MVSFQDVTAAHERLRGHALRTPLLVSEAIDAAAGARVFFKCENLQNMGAFKFRGAYNALAQLSPEERSRGVLAFSSGNHAQAVALAGRMLGIKAVIVMPADAPGIKLEATRGYGAEVITYAKGEDREALAGRIAGERKLVLIPPFNHPHVIAGQGTAAKELFEETGPLDALVVPCGGGGLISGCALAARALSPGCRVIGVEPAAGNDVTLSFQSGKIVKIGVPDTIADGARTQAPGELTFALIRRNVDQMATVTDAEILRWMFFVWEKMRLVVEPTGMLAAAAVLERRLGLSGKRVGVIFSGGNVDLRWAASQL